jgi:hypothetical protein
MRGVTNNSSLGLVGLQPKGLRNNQHEKYRLSQTVFTHVKFKFYVMDSSGRHIIRIVNIDKSIEEIILDNNFRFKTIQ